VDKRVRNSPSWKIIRMLFQKGEFLGENSPPYTQAVDCCHPRICRPNCCQTAPPRNRPPYHLLQCPQRLRGGNPGCSPAECVRARLPGERAAAESPPRMNRQPAPAASVAPVPPAPLDSQASLSRGLISSERATRPPLRLFCWHRRNSSMDKQCPSAKHHLVRRPDLLRSHTLTGPAGD